EKEFKCKIETDAAFPYYPKLQATPRNAPLYDVLHTNSNEQWQAVIEGLVEEKLDPKKVPNLADVYPYAVSDKIVGVSAFTSAIGFGYRTDKGLAPPKSWKDLSDPKLAGQRASYLVPVNSIGQMHLMMLGKVYGKGLQDLDAAYAALEAHKPIKLYDFTGQMEKALLSGEVSMGVLHDSGVFRYDGQNQPIEFAAPQEGVLALEQVWSVTAGSKVKELAYAYIDFMLRPLGRRAAAGGAGAGAGGAAAGAVVRRAARGARPQAASIDAVRIESVAEGPRRHADLRHPRPGRGDGDGR